MDSHDNPWVELAQEGLTRLDQIEDCKNWLARRQAALDQMKKHFEDDYFSHSARCNFNRLNTVEAFQFNIDLWRWELGQFIESHENHGT